MNWNAWPQNTQGDIIVPTIDDQTLLSAAHAVGKTFMMALSPLQFKHIDDSGANYYRRGEDNLEFRFGQGKYYTFPKPPLTPPTHLYPNHY